MAQITLSPEELNSALDRFLWNPMAPEFAGPPIATRLPPVDWAAENIQPSSPLFIDRLDRLLFSVLTRTANITLQVDAVLLTPSGETIPVQETILTTGASTLQNVLILTGAGFLLSLSVSAQTSGVQRGECYVQVGLLRTLIAEPRVNRPLLSDYVYFGRGLGWPVAQVPGWSVERGRLRVSTVANPAAGANWTFTVPDSIYLRVVGGSATLTSDATGINRFVMLQMDDGTNVVYRNGTEFAQPASTATLYTWSLLGTNQSGPNAQFQAIALPQMFLQGTGRLLGLATNIQAGDQWSAIRVYTDEYIEI